MNGWLELTRMETRGYFRSKAALFWTFAYPVLLLVLMAAIFSRSDRGYLITGMAALTIISTALFGFTGVLIDLRARGALIPLQLMPMDRVAFLTGFASSRLIVLVLFTLLFTVVGNVVYDAKLLVTLPTLTTFSLLAAAGSLAFLGLGLILAALVSKTVTAQALINILNLPIIFLSDLFIPVRLMPDWIQTCVQWSPVYLFVTALRQSLTDGAGLYELAGTILILLTLAVIGFGLAGLLFRWRASP
jgi:ABC-2 type transport system permease protein